MNLKELAELKKALEYFRRLEGTKPLLNLYPTDGKLHSALKECTALWFEKEADDVTNTAIDDFLKAMFTVLAEKKLQRKFMLEIKKLGGVGYKSGGVHGKNKYSADKSRVDGKLIQRKRR